jgi:AcrR family transcriptional regulator
MRKRSETIRKTILAAARQLFLNQGYVATTVDAIAEQAKVTKRTVYGYFPDKRALFAGVIEDAVGDPWEFHIPMQAISTLEGLENALLIVATSINDVITQPDYVQLLRVTIAEIPAQPDLGVLFEHGITRRSLKTLTSLFTVADEHDMLHVREPEVVARQFVGGFVVRVFLDGLLQSNQAHMSKQTKTELSVYVGSFISRVAYGNRTARG